MKRILSFFLILSLVSAFPVFAGGRRGNTSAAPRLFEPSDDTDLTGKNELIFRWGSEGDRSVITDYQFKLYKGAQTVESGLIKAETVPARINHLSLPADLFKNGETYAWQLRGTGSGKTRPAYAVFKISNK